MARIIELRGEDYEEKLVVREKYIGRMDLLYLKCLLKDFEKELWKLKKC